VAVRICPQCNNVVPALLAVAYSDGLECPHCKTVLEVGSAGRMSAIWIALLAAWVVWYITRTSVGTSTDTIAWVLPELYAILTFGIVSPLLLMLNARLVIAPTVPAIDLPGATGGHGSGHDTGHGAHH
jgi:hypothetical protein